MEIDDQKQQQLEAPTAVPEGFNTDYLRVYYGKLIPLFFRDRVYYGKLIPLIMHGTDK